MKPDLFFLCCVALAILRGHKLFLSRTSVGWVASTLMSSAETTLVAT